MTDPRANNRDFTMLFLVMLITGAGNTALQSVLPTLGRTIGVPDSVIAAAFSVSAAIGCLRHRAGPAGLIAMGGAKW